MGHFYNAKRNTRTMETPEIKPDIPTPLNDGKKDLSYCIYSTPHDKKSAKMRIMHKLNKGNLQFLHEHKMGQIKICQNGVKVVCSEWAESQSNSLTSALGSETAAPATTIMFKCAKMRLVIQSAVGKPVNVMCFENGSDNLFPNPLIGSQCSLLRTHKAAGWRELERIPLREPSTPGR